MVLKRRRSYLYGAWLPCQATTSSGEWSIGAATDVPAELRQQLEAPVEILVPGRRREEVARVGQPVRADRAQIRQPQRRPEVLAHVASCLARRAARPESAGRAGRRRSPAARSRARRARWPAAAARAAARSAARRRRRRRSARASSGSRRTSESRNRHVRSGEPLPPDGGESGEKVRRFARHRGADPSAADSAGSTGAKRLVMQPSERPGGTRRAPPQDGSGTASCAGWHAAAR